MQSIVLCFPPTPHTTRTKTPPASHHSRRLRSVALAYGAIELSVRIAQGLGHGERIQSASERRPPECAEQEILDRIERRNMVHFEAADAIA